MPATRPPAVPRLTYLRIRNYRALHDVEFRDLTPLTVLVGPNGSGKSTVLDALAFLAEAVGGNLVQAWEKRNRFQGMRTRGSDGPIEFELAINCGVKSKNIFYSITLQELNNKVEVVSEKLFQKDRNGKPDLTFIIEKTFENRFSRFKVISKKSAKITTTKHPLGLGIGADIDGFSAGTARSQMDFLSSIDSPLKVQAVSFIAALTSYRYIHLTDNHSKGISDAGPRERLSANGDNLPNVLYYLQEKHPAVLQTIVSELKRQIPALGDVLTEMTSDERLLLRFKDTPFEKPLPAQYMSDGTLRLAALLTLLHEPNASGLLGLEEPENELHPRLLPGLAEALVQASENRQLLVATHAPALLNALAPEQVWVLHRGPDGYTQATRTADLPGIAGLMAEGSPLGYLWQSNFFDVGDPLAGTGPAAPGTDAA